MLDPPGNRLFVALRSHAPILADIPLDGGEQSNHLFLADLQGPGESLVGRPIDGNGGDHLLGAHDETAGLWSPEVLPPGENGRVRAELLRELPKIFRRR